jgi:hypothetical protein
LKDRKKRDQEGEKREGEENKG